MKKMVMVLMMACLIATSYVAISHAAADWYICNVTGTGARNNSTYFKLTDVNGAFSNLWYVADPSMANAQLATALTAMSSGLHVYALVDPATPYTAPAGLYLWP